MINVPPKLKEFLDEARAPLPPITDLDELLHIDSLGVIRLVAFLQNDLGFVIEDEEFVSDNFETLRRICELLESKKQSPPSG